VDIRRFFFKNRGFTPVPFILAALILAKPTRLSFWTGLAVVLAGECIRFWGVSYSGRSTRTIKVGGSRLVTDGPYAHVRNPLYIGNFLMAAGWTIMGWPWMPWMALVVLLFFSIQYHFIVDLEEEFLSGKFGAVFESYRKAVPRWIPRLRPYADAESMAPDRKAALRSERNTFQAIAVIAALIFLRWKLF
jgi:protein-S-isoprenylcysteine O-methyltransferase Ste14